MLAPKDHSKKVKSDVDFLTFRRNITKGYIFFNRTRDNTIELFIKGGNMSLHTGCCLIKRDAKEEEMR